MNQQVGTPNLDLTINPPDAKPRSPSPQPAPRISAKRQKELDDLNRMMEDDEPEGIHSQVIDLI
jgi:hypothetical protein